MANASCITHNRAFLANALRITFDNFGILALNNPFSNGIFSRGYVSELAFLGNSKMAETAYTLSSCPSTHN